MKKLGRFLPFVLSIAGAWAIGFYFGHTLPSDPKKGGSVSASATPFPEHTADGRDPALTSTAIGRLIDGQSDFGRQHRLLDYAENLDAAALPGAASEAMQLPLKYRNEALLVLFARWAEVDPAAAAKYAHLLPRSAGGHGLRDMALGAWAEKDLDAAIAWASALEAGTERSESIEIIAGALAKADPNAAIRLVHEHLGKRDAQSAYSSIFSSWAENDFAGAVSAARGLDDPLLRSSALRAALQQHIEKDPRLVLDIIRDAKIADLRWTVGSQAIHRWAEHDLAAAREYVLNHPAGELRSTMINSVVREMAVRDPRDAMDWILARKETGDIDGGLHAALSIWSGRDPDAAIQAVRDLPEGTTRDEAIGILAQNLVGSDPASAVELAKEIPEGSARDSAVQQIAHRWARIDPKAAAEWMLANTSEDRRWSMHQIMWEWSRSDPEGALTWVKSLPENERKGEMLGRVLSNFAHSNPRYAADLVENLQPEAQRGAVGAFIDNWSQRDPVAAATWATGKLMDEQARSTALSTIASTWAGRDPAAASQWLEKLKPGSERDAAVKSFSDIAAQRDPEGAIAWAATIGGKKQRYEAIFHAWHAWVRTSPERAVEWSRTTPLLTEDERRNFIKPPEPRHAVGPTIIRTYP
jgi:hypothetical protein